MRFTYKHENGQKRATLDLSSRLEAPFILIDTATGSVEVSCDWDSWPQRFPNGFPDSMHLIDSIGVPYALNRVGNDGRDIPLLATQQVQASLSLEELTDLYIAWCQLNSRRFGDLSQVATLNEFATQVLSDFGLTV
jgi:hypothetical protein